MYFNSLVVSSPFLAAIDDFTAGLGGALDDGRVKGNDSSVRELILRWEPPQFLALDIFTEQLILSYYAKNTYHEYNNNHLLITDDYR